MWWRLKITLSQLTNKINGGVKASRNNSKCYSNQKLKEIQSVRYLSFSRKHLSLENAYTPMGISGNLINLLNVGTSGDVSTMGNISANVSLAFTFYRLYLISSLNYGRKTL